MITLYSYPELFGVADNNGYGLKVFAFLRLAGVPFTHEHIFDASKAPRGQLPYIVGDGETIGDSETIIAHVTAKYRLAIDAALTAAQRDTDLLITRMLDDLYWVMSYSRWKDERYWPAFRDALIRGPVEERAVPFVAVHFAVLAGAMKRLVRVEELDLVVYLLSNLRPIEVHERIRPGDLTKHKVGNTRAQPQPG